MLFYVEHNQEAWMSTILLHQLVEVQLLVYDWFHRYSVSSLMCRAGLAIIELVEQVVVVMLTMVP